MVFRGILVALGLMNFGFGVVALVQPTILAGWVGLGLEGPAAFGEIRAVFGGAVGVVGVLFVAAALIPDPSRLLAGLALVFAALSAGRLVSLAVDGWSLYTVAALALEAGIAAISGYLWRHPEELRDAVGEAQTTTAPPV